MRNLAKNAKVATVIVSFFPLAFFGKLYDLYFKWMKEIFHERLTTFDGIRELLTELAI